MAVSFLFCDYCGAQNPANEHFCFSCGYALSASTTAMSVSSTLIGPLLAHTLLRQRYRILQVVGQGGMGAVYLAQDISLGDHLVAIKEMSQNNNQPRQEILENFKREAHLLASLQHPNLPSIYDHFEESGRWYFVMSFIQGETLEEYLSHTQGQKLSLDDAVHVGQELCNVLAYLHTHRPPIIFRDLKPGNIMRSTDGHIYLIDFGIARHFKPGQVKDTANYGSAGYAPPEQYGKAQTTERSDIYSLGVTLYEILSGYDPSQSPFRFPPLQSLVPTLPKRLVSLIMQMLEIDESKRPANIKMVQQGLQQISVPVSSTTRRYAPVLSKPTPTSPSTPKQSLLLPPMPTPSVAQRQIQVQRHRAAKIARIPVQQEKTKNKRDFTALAAAIWRFLGVLLFLNGISGPFRFNLTLAGGIFGLVSICGFSGLIGLMIILLTRTKASFFPVTKARRIEYIVVGFIGGASIVFGITIAILGEVTKTSTNFNEIGVELGIILLIVGIITLWVTHIRIKNTP